MKYSEDYKEKEPCLLMSDTYSNSLESHKNDQVNFPIGLFSNFKLNIGNLDDKIVKNQDKNTLKSNIKVSLKKQQPNPPHIKILDNRNKISSRKKINLNLIEHGYPSMNSDRNNNKLFSNGRWRNIKSPNRSESFAYKARSPSNRHKNEALTAQISSHPVLPSSKADVPRYTPNKLTNSNEGNDIVNNKPFCPDRISSINFVDNASCETICSFSRNLEEERASRCSNSDPKTLSNGSLGSSRNIESGGGSYLLEDCVSVRDINDSSNNEIVLDINDSSNTLRKTINLETLSRIDSVFIGNDAPKLRYRLPLVNSGMMGIGRHNKYSDNKMNCRNNKAAVKRVKAVRKKHSATVYTTSKDGKILDKSLSKVNKKKKSKRSIIRLCGVITIYYSVLIMAIYLLLCENPLWEGMALKAWRMLYERNEYSYGFLVWVIIALINVVPPMFVFFEDDNENVSFRDSSNVALIIPAYKAAKILSKTLSAAIEIFPPENIFVIANGNSIYPLDNTEEVCSNFRVNHCWVPYGCKLGALYVGVCRVASYKYVVLIDDDCLLPFNFPLPVERFKNGVACVGYTITSCGPNFTKGNIVHKLQDIEYKFSGLMKQFQGKFGGSTIFPHGAVSMWDRDIIYKLFDRHPGYQIGEDWFFGHVARRLGYRIELCTKVFVKTETPRSIFISPNTTRGGFGELTVAKQRIFRWNYFLLKCLMDNIYYILFCWRMPRWYHNVLCKIWVIMEVIQTIQHVIFPLAIPLFIKNTYFTLSVALSLMTFSFIIVIMFNLLHLGRKNDARVDWIPVFMFVPYIIICYVTNLISYVWAILHYGIYYSKKHLRVTKIPEVVSIVSGGIDNITMSLHKSIINPEQKHTGITTSPNNFSENTKTAATTQKEYDGEDAFVAGNQNFTDRNVFAMDPTNVPSSNSLLHKQKSPGHNFTNHFRIQKSTGPCANISQFPSPFSQNSKTSPMSKVFYEDIKIPINLLQ